MTNIKMDIGRVRDNLDVVGELYNNTQLYNSHTPYYGGQVRSGIYPQISTANSILSSNLSASEIKPTTRQTYEITPSNYMATEIKPDNYSIKDY